MSSSTPLPQLHPNLKNVAGLIGTWKGKGVKVTPFELNKLRRRKIPNYKEFFLRRADPVLTQWKAIFDISVPIDSSNNPIDKKPGIWRQMRPCMGKLATFGFQIRRQLK
jgi:hypothetical protein